MEDPAESPPRTGAAPLPQKPSEVSVEHDGSRGASPERAALPLQTPVQTPMQTPIQTSESQEARAGGVDDGELAARTPLEGTGGFCTPRAASSDGAEDTEVEVELVGDADIDFVNTVVQVAGEDSGDDEGAAVRAAQEEGRDEEEDDDDASFYDATPGVDDEPQGRPSGDGGDAGSASDSDTDDEDDHGELPPVFLVAEESDSGTVQQPARQRVRGAGTPYAPAIDHGTDAERAGRSPWRMLWQLGTATPPPDTLFSAARPERVRSDGGVTPSERFRRPSPLAVATPITSGGSILAPRVEVLSVAQLARAKQLAWQLSAIAVELRERYVTIPNFNGRPQLVTRLLGLFSNDPDDIDVGVVYLVFIVGLEKVLAEPDPVRCGRPPADRFQIS